jgi:hypothetical protein
VGGGLHDVVVDIDSTIKIDIVVDMNIMASGGVCTLRTDVLLADERTAS